MEDDDTALWLELPADCAFVPIERIRPLVLDTKLGHLDSKHGADGAFAALREAEALGFNNESTDTANIRRAIQERRAAGQLVVYEKDGFGVIRDDDFMGGALKREDFARLLGDEWNIALREPSQGAPLPHTPRVQSKDAGIAASAVPIANPVAGAAEPEQPFLANNKDKKDKKAPLPLTTGDIAFCFDGLRWSEAKWKKPLGDKPKWLRACIAIPGRPGVSETRWDPVCIGAYLVKEGHVPARSVRAKFQSQPMLKPWLDAWKTYEADYIDSE